LAKADYVFSPGLEAELRVKCGYSVDLGLLHPCILGDSSDGLGRDVPLPLLDELKEGDNAGLIFRMLAKLF